MKYFSRTKIKPAISIRGQNLNLFEHLKVPLISSIVIDQLRLVWFYMLPALFHIFIQRGKTIKAFITVEVSRDSTGMK